MNKVAQPFSLEELVETEWQLFQGVQNVGGRATCQDMHRTFQVMRLSTLTVWPEPIQRAYWEHLKLSMAEGRNLLTEKYARMMESTSPEEYARLQDKLPPLGQEEKTLVDELTKLEVLWAEDFQQRYPAIASRSRPVHRDSDSLYVTSIETYSRGEMSTYGVETLRLLLDFYRQCRAEGKNLNELTVAHTARLQGYRDLNEAERAMSGQR